MWLTVSSTAPEHGDYMAVLLKGRVAVERTQSWGERLRRWALRTVLPSRAFGPLLSLGRAVRPLLPRALARQVPQAAPLKPPAWPSGHQNMHARRVLMPLGCVQPHLRPHIDAATARVDVAVFDLDLPTLAEALRQQQNDRTVPIGELLVRLGLVSRQDLMSALARKMGYPMVDLEKFVADPDALNKVPFSVAARLRALPLMLRDTSVIVALEDPSKRALLSELEFVTQCKIVPVPPEPALDESWAEPMAFDGCSSNSRSGRSSQSAPS